MQTHLAKELSKKTPKSPPDLEMSRRVTVDLMSQNFEAAQVTLPDAYYNIAAHYALRDTDPYMQFFLLQGLPEYLKHFLGSSPDVADIVESADEDEVLTVLYAVLAVSMEVASPQVMLHVLSHFPDDVADRYFYYDSQGQRVDVPADHPRVARARENIQRMFNSAKTVLVLQSFEKAWDNMFRRIAMPTHDERVVCETLHMMFNGRYDNASVFGKLSGDYTGNMGVGYTENSALRVNVMLERHQLIKGVQLVFQSDVEARNARSVREDVHKKCILSLNDGRQVAFSKAFVPDGPVISDDRELAEIQKFFMSVVDVIDELAVFLNPRPFVPGQRE